MASGTIPKQITRDDLFVSPTYNVANGGQLTITFSGRDNGFISVTGNGTDRIALYAFSGMNGATPVVSRVSGANLNFAMNTATITFTPALGYGAAVKVLAFNGNISFAIS